LARLLAAFVVVSFVPIAVLAALSLQEFAADPAAHQEGGETGEPAGHGTVAGIPIEFVELGVAGVSLALSVAAALYIGRTIIRPMRSLETSMHRVETGDLDVVADVQGDDEIGHLATAFNRMTGGLRREAMVRDLFGQYVSPEVARLAIEQHGQLAEQVVECTVLFVDIRRFTALAEVLPPVRLIGTLNRYFDRMLTAVEAEGGIVNKFGGDSLLAVFGSPLNPMPNHAERAVRAALRMRLALAEFNREQADTEMPELRVGFGLATGELVAGNVGSSRKLEYTVIGDPVNLAARVARVRSLGPVEVRGRAERVEVFAADGPLADDAPAVDSAKASAPPSSANANS
jgi:class 3 adenylate cyclase